MLCDFVTFGNCPQCRKVKWALFILTEFFYVALLRSLAVAAGWPQRRRRPG
jgi:hypothetical protein